MLIFKKNIYEKGDLLPTPKGDPTPGPRLNAYQFVRNSITEDLEFFRLLEQSSPPVMAGDLVSFFPNAHRYSTPKTIKNLLQILWKGLEDPDLWYHMNTYHFCLLYDSFFRQAYNYNHDSLEEKLSAYPELKGKPIPFRKFVQDYFFNTVFLLTPDKYNSLTSRQKKENGYTCPCQFGVIHGLAPTPEEMELKVEHNYPYALLV